MQFLIVSYIPIELMRETTADSFPGDSDTHENLRTAGGRRSREAGGKGGEEGQGGQSWEQGHARLCAGRGLNVMRQRSHDPQRQGLLGTKRRSLGPESCLPERDRICAHPAWPIM